MARPTNRRQREAANERARAAAEDRRRATRRRQRILAGAVAAVIVLGLVGAVLGSRADRSTSTSTTTTTSPAPTPTTRPLPSGGVEPVAAPMGATISGPTPCPAEDGSSPRTTLFTEAPPVCIDAGYFHVATIRTSVGDLTVQLNPARAPRTVNDFVVLARYHFYDDQPVTSIRSRASFTVGIALSGPDAERAPGFAIPAEAAAQGQVLTPGMLAMAPSAPGSGSSRGQLVVATYEDAAGIDPEVTAFGVMLAGDETLAAIDALATADGAPARPVTIESVTVARTSPIPS